MSPFLSLDDWVRDVVKRLSPAEQRALGYRISRTLRKSNAARIRRNVTPPDGEAMIARKARKERPVKKALEKKRRSIRAGLMFKRAARANVLRALPPEGNEARMGFSGSIGRVMRVHQEGLKDHVTKSSSSPEVQYPRRPVLGYTEADREEILNAVLEQIAEA